MRIDDFTDNHSDRWFGNEVPYTAKEKRILITQWGGEASNAFNSSKYDKQRKKCWSMTGCLLSNVEMFICGNIVGANGVIPPRRFLGRNGEGTRASYGVSNSNATQYQDQTKKINVELWNVAHVIDDVKQELNTIKNKQTQSQDAEKMESLEREVISLNL